MMPPARHGPASPESERDCPQSRALVVRCEHRAGEQPSAEALETLREWALAHGCGGLEAGWRATTQTRHHDGPTSGQVDRYYYSPSGETIGPTALMPPTESLIVITATTTNCVRRAAEVAPRGRKVCSPAPHHSSFAPHHPFRSTFSSLVSSSHALHRGLSTPPSLSPRPLSAQVAWPRLRRKRRVEASEARARVRAAQRRRRRGGAAVRG